MKPPLVSSAGLARQSRPVLRSQLVPIRLHEERLSDLRRLSKLYGPGMGAVVLCTIDGKAYSYRALFDELTTEGEAVPLLVSVGDRRVRIDPETFTPYGEDCGDLSQLDMAELAMICDDHLALHVLARRRARASAIRQCVIDGDFTQTQLAKRRGITPQAISRWLTEQCEEVSS